MFAIWSSILRTQLIDFLDLPFSDLDDLSSICFCGLCLWLVICTVENEESFVVFMRGNAIDTQVTRKFHFLLIFLALTLFSILQQLYSIATTDATGDVEAAAAITDWLSNKFLRDLGRKVFDEMS
ncbi:hypothetical protein Droror1_Dr00014796 [Drosera rotundifolia]